MSEVLENGFRVKTLFGGTVKVEKFLAEGGQGGVYIADYNGQKKALKWYKKGSLGANPNAFYENIKQNVMRGIPSPEFLWPLDITEWVDGTFGYIMDLRPEGYYEVTEFMLCHSLMGGVHTFYKYLTCQIIQMGQEKFKSWLPDFLTGFSAEGIFSRSGSGDDISVSGIVDVDRIALFKEVYAYDIKLYDLEEAIFWKEDELRGKTRKHGILKKRLEDAQLILDNAIADLNTFVDSLTRLQDYRAEFADKVKSAKEELEEYRQDAEAATVQFEGRYAARFASAMQHFIEEISTGYSQKEATYSKMLEQLMELEGKIKQKEEIVSCKNNILELEEKRDDAKSTFEEYDAKYKSIEIERDKLKEQIVDLKEGM